MVVSKTSHAEMVFKLRKRIQDAVKLNVVNENSKETFELTLLQIMNEAERQRIHCHRMVSDFEQKAQGAKSQASAYEAMISIVYSILNGLVRKAEQDEEEIKELEEAEAEAEAETKVEIVKEPKVEKTEDKVVRPKRTRLPKENTTKKTVVKKSPKRRRSR
jgi:hypothetical protein